MTLANAAGLLPDGSPYVEVSLSDDDDEHEHPSDDKAKNGLFKFNKPDDEGHLSDGVLSPGEKVKNVLLKFNNPKRVKFTFNHSVLGVIPQANHPPVANAGANQSAFVGSVVTLDGSGSTDEDGNPLTYHWRIVSQPATNAAVLDNASAIKPRLTINSKGTYQIELIVNDGSVDSAPATVLVTTENSKPVAAAGDDQTVFINQTAFLDGILSHDVDNDPLTFHWQLSAKPETSLATLQNPDTQTPNLSPDKPGPYTVELVVNDGLLDSLADQVIINTQNSRPVANAGPDQVDKTVGIPVKLDGSLSSDADGDALTYIWSLLHQPAGSSAVIQQADQVKSSFTPDKVGDYVGQLIVNDGQAASDPATALVTVSVMPPVNNPPQITSSPLLTATVGSLYSYDVDAGDPDNDTLSYSLSAYPSGMTIDAQSGLISWTPEANQAGSQSVSVNVADGKGGSDSQSFTVTVVPSGLITVPELVGLSRAAAETAIDNANLNLGTLSFDNNPASPGSVISQNPGAGASVAKGTAIALTVSLGPDQGLPPDPAIIAPALSPTTSFTPLNEVAEFLYTGANPVQTGVNPGTIEAKRIAVVRGKVLTRDDQPLAGVAITVHGHPEFGETLTRADGQFDMVVNGGGFLTLNYRKANFLPVQRQVNAPWQDYAMAEDAVLIPVDSQVTAINLSATTPQIAQSSLSADADGQRQATLLFPTGTQAVMTLADGSTQPLTDLHVRATEYTVGANGPKAMPGALPPSSGYTYAVELSIDEALAAGATRVNFNQPLPVYVDNYLGFPVGEIVPAGWYDREKNAWIPSLNGRVIKLLGVSGGAAAIDTNGDNLADTAAQLSALGITPAEQTQLAALYPVGKSLWRVPVSHFTPWDFNWPWGLPSGATQPTNKEPKAENQDNPDSCNGNTTTGCVIEAQNQILGEDLKIVGTPYGVHYRSDRILGNKRGYTLNIPLSDAAVPASLKRIELIVSVAGREFKQSFAPAPNLTYTFTWDGKNAYGQRVQSRQKALIRIGYVYGAVYFKSSTAFAASFANPSNSTGGSGSGGFSIVASPAHREIIQWKEWKKQMGEAKNRVHGLGGWSLSAHHVYDPAAKALYRGDGSRIQAENFSKIIDTVAGNGLAGFSGDAGLATAASLNNPRGLVLLPDGGMYIVETSNHRVRKVKPDGTIITIAGTGSAGFAGDGGPATSAQLNNPRAIALATDGSLLITDTSNHRIRRVKPDGIITTLAGTGSAGFSGDGGQAAAAQINEPIGLAVSADGSVYIADQFNNRIRKIGTNGIISTFAGNGTAGYSGDNGNALSARLNQPREVALAPDGSVFFSDTLNNRIRRIAPNGIITTAVGTGIAGYAGDGGQAISAKINGPRGLAVSPDGTLYVADTENHRVRRISVDGVITTIAGTGAAGFSGDKSNAASALLNGPISVALAFDGSIVVAEWGNHRVRRISSPFPSFAAGELAIPSQDGSEVYKFNASGRHIETRSTLTNAVIYRFAYDSQGLLQSVTDVDGDITRIERNSTGKPTAIMAPDGQRTTLALDANGYLASVANPAGETHAMAYSADGLLTQFTTPEGHANNYSYDNLGRLTQDTDPVGGGWTLNRSEQAAGFTTRMTSGEGRTRQYRIEPLADGGRRQVNTQPDGTVQTTLLKTNGEKTITGADGVLTTLLQSPDPRFGMQAPIAGTASVKLPSGLTSTASTARTATLAIPTDLLSLTSLTETSTVNGKVYTSVFDKAGLTYTTTSPAGRITRTRLNDKGRPVQSTIADLLPVSYTYDERGRTTLIEQGSAPDQRTSQISYNAQGYVDTLTDALGRSSAFEYDLAGRVTRQILPDQREIHYAYDANGNLASLIPPGRPPHVFAYTPVDLPADYTPPTAGLGNSQTLYHYNKDKQPTRITRPDGQLLEFSYQPASGQLTSLTLPNGAYSYQYSAGTGQLTAVTDPDGGQLGYSYDGFLLKNINWTGTVTGSVGKTYDNDFRVSTVSVNGTNPFTYQYDNDSLLTAINNTALGISLTLARNAQNGLLTGTALGNLTDSYSYNGFGEVTGYLAKYATADLYKTDVSRDKLGRITQKIETVGGSSHTYDYAYDTAGRLIEVKQNGIVQSSYGYDDNGNRTDLNGAPIAHYDAQDRLLDYNNATYDYTANGELKSKTVGNATTSYHYDVLANLRQVTLPNGTVLDYVIDGQNRRIGKKRNNVLEQGFLYQDQLKPIAELDGNNQIVSRFVYATGANVPDFMIKGGATYRLIKDHLGSPRLVVDIATNTVVQRIDYDVWGKVIQDSNPGFQPFGYAGGLYDGDTGLVRFGARDYDAETGRWTAKDPIGFEGGDTNLYGYVVNDPVRWTDLLGLRPNVDTYPTPDAAATVALLENNAQSIAQDAEYSGAVYQLPGEDVYRYSEATTTGSRDSSRLLADIPSDAAYIETYHTHGANSPDFIIKGVNYNNIFSPNDIAIANAIAKPNVMINPAYNIQKYDPKYPKTGRKGKKLPFCQK